MGVAAVGIVVLIIVALTGGDDDSKNSDHDDAASFVSKIHTHAQSVASDLNLVLSKTRDSDVTGDYVDLASNAETLHDNMQQFREELLTAADLNNDDQSALIDAENDLKAGVGTIIRWTDDPTSASLTARWAREIGQGAGRWNALVKSIWSNADVIPVPTIVIPDS